MSKAAAEANAKNSALLKPAEKKHEKHSTNEKSSTPEKPKRKSLSPRSRVKNNLLASEAVRQQCRVVRRLAINSCPQHSAEIQAHVNVPNRRNILSRNMSRNIPYTSYTNLPLKADAIPRHPVRHIRRIPQSLVHCASVHLRFVHSDIFS